MGAELWRHPAPWHEDPQEALEALQAQFLRETYGLPALIQQHLDSWREAVRRPPGRLPSEVLDSFRRELHRLEKLASQPIPRDPRQQIEVVRQVFAGSGQGVGNVLDERRVSRRRGLGLAKRLTPKEVQRLCSVERLTQHQASAAAFKISDDLRRGESVCFPFYAAGAPRRRVGTSWARPAIEAVNRSAARHRAPSLTVCRLSRARPYPPTAGRSLPRGRWPSAGRSLSGFLASPRCVAAPGWG